MDTSKEEVTFLLHVTCMCFLIVELGEIKSRVIQRRMALKLTVTDSAEKHIISEAKYLR